MITFIDLFAGVGGFHLGFEGKAQCVFASEWDKNARKTYMANFGKQLLEQKAVFAEDIPKVIFLENVKNLQAHDSGNTFKVIKAELEKQGYTVFHQILNAKTHGNTPQNRERIFIVAFLDKKQAQKFSWPKPVPLKKKWTDCLEGKVDSKYYQTNKESASVQRMIEGVTNASSIYQYRRFYVRENKNGVCPTLTANMGTGGHNVPLIKDAKGVRKLTPRECFNFQGFPKSFKLPDISDASLYKQAGNSVPVKVVARVSCAIMETFL